MPPGVAEVWPSVLVIDRSADGASVSVSVALLFAGFGSVTPPATETVAVLTRLPVAAASTLQVAVYVTLPLTGRFTTSPRLPLPDAVQVPPPAPAQVQLTLVHAAGKLSDTVEPGAAEGPALLAVIV